MWSRNSKHMAVPPTGEVASLSWRDNGIVYVADSEDEAIDLSNQYAPEHLELQVRNQAAYMDRLVNYGSLFIGEETTVAYGDKTIGTNHILPTSSGSPLHGRRVGREISEDLHVSAHDPEQAPKSVESRNDSVNSKIC